MDKKGYLSCILLQKPQNNVNLDDHYIETNWDKIPMLSVLTGKNGIGKSTILKMINFYFNRVQLNYTTKDKQLKYNCNNGEIDPDISVSLIHFDNNSIDLRSRDYTLKSYNNMLQYQPKNKELNFSNEIKKLELELIERTSITLFFKNDVLKNNLVNHLLINFGLIIEISHFESEIKLKEYFSKLILVKRIQFLTSILKFKSLENLNEVNQNKVDPFLQKTTSIRRILIDNIANLEEINEILKNSKPIFQHEIFIDIKSKVFYWKKTSSVSELDLDQQLILFNTLKKHQKRNHECKNKKNQVLLENFSNETVDEFINLLLFENLITVNDLNKELKDSGFTNEIQLEIYFDLLFDSKNKLISLETLSNGEQIILFSILWEYLMTKHSKKQSKNILLLDEPDAHMHPSAIYAIVESIKKLVKKFEFQIKMTTHNPTTVHFFDEKNLFLLYKDGGDLKIKSGITRYEIANRLTSNLVHIQAPSKTLIVEGLDIAFYEKLHSIIRKFYNIPLHFNLHINNLKNGLANKYHLKNAIKGIDFIFGIVDEDDDFKCGDLVYMKRLFYLKRYSKENYVYDPINIFFYLCEKKHKNLEKFFEDIRKEIIKVNQEYANYNDLKSFLNMIYSDEIDKQNESIKILQIIVDEFSKYLENYLFQKIVNNNSNLKYSEIFKIQCCHKLFNISDSIKGNDKKLIIKPEALRKHLQEKKIVEKLKEENLKNKINNDKKMELSEIENDFKTNNFDLSKFSNVEEIQGLTKKLNDIYQKNIKNKEDTFEIEFYFKSKKFKKNENLIGNIEKFLKLFPTISQSEDLSQTEIDELEKELKIILFEEKSIVHINGLELKYPNIFIRLRGHDLESILNKIFNEYGINCKSLIEKSDVIIPDELLSIYRNLCSNVIEITEDLFEYTVFNSNENWFVKFTPKKNSFNDFFTKAAIELDRQANFGIYYAETPSEDRIFNKYLSNTTNQNEKLMFFDSKHDKNDFIDYVFDESSKLINHCRNKIECAEIVRNF